MTELTVLTADEILCNDWFDSPEGQAQTFANEDRYRKGYWDGVYQAIECLKVGATLRQLECWQCRELRAWRYDNCIEVIMPPKLAPWKHLRKIVLDLYDHVCVYCGNSATHVDHVLPVSRGGDYTLDNLVAACAGCNLRKNTKTPEEAGMKIHTIPSLSKLAKAYEAYEKLISWY